jgi:hypothetical protein
VAHRQLSFRSTNGDSPATVGQTRRLGDRPKAGYRLRSVRALPITSLSSVVGMNVIVNDSTKWIPLIILFLIMLAISLTLLRWAHKQGWW